VGRSTGGREDGPRMTRAIPEQIVAAVTQLAESLASWCEEGRDGRLEQHEAAVLERVRQVLPQVLEAVVEVATSGLAPRVRGSRSACPRCGRKVRPHQERSRQALPRCGMVVIERPWYACARCHHGWSVVETTLGVGSRQRASVGLLGWLVRLGAMTDYRDAAELLDELTGLAVGPETIRRECVRVGTAIRAAEAAVIEQTQRTRAAAESLDPAPGLLVLEADGANGLFTNGWHEVKIGMVAGWDRPAAHEARRHALVRDRRRRHARPARPPALAPTPRRLTWTTEVSHTRDLSAGLTKLLSRATV